MEFKKLLKIFLASVSLPLMLVSSTLATEVKITRAALDYLVSNFRVQDKTIVCKNSDSPGNQHMIPINSDRFSSDPANNGGLICDCELRNGDTSRDPFSFDTLCYLLNVDRASFEAITRLINFSEGLFYEEDETEKCILALPNEIRLPLQSEHRNCVEGIRWWVTRNQVDSMNLVLVPGEEARKELLA